jgi:hypothetical protein
VNGYLELKFRVKCKYLFRVACLGSTMDGIAFKSKVKEKRERRRGEGRG